MSKGRVYLVGAGPGDPGLITVKALNLIKRCDVILYDSLVNPLLLSHCRKDAMIFNCGKRGDKTSFPQKDILELMSRYASEEKEIVRLKGGDSWLFSRGAEEAEYLSERNIPFVVVPGIPSPLAAAAYTGIPISHRDHSSSIAIATGRPKGGKSVSDLRIPDADTIIYLMAVSNLETIVERLISNGRSKDEPAALIQNASLGNQRLVEATLGTIAQKAREENFESPAIFVVGDVVPLCKHLNWFQRLPLKGRHLIITRPAEDSWPMVEQLVSLGADIELCPTIKISPFDEAKAFFSDVNISGRYSDIVFTSKNGVRIFFEYMNAHGLDTRALAGCQIHGIGPKTRGTLKAHGILIEKLPDEYSSEGLARYFDGKLNNRRFLLPRAKEADGLLDEVLEKRGATVERLTLYTIAPNKTTFHTPGVQSVDGVVVASQLSARYFMEMRTWPKGAVAFCIGKKTAEAFEGTETTVVISDQATSESLTESIVKYYSNESSFSGSTGESTGLNTGSSDQACPRQRSRVRR